MRHLTSRNIFQAVIIVVAASLITGWLFWMDEGYYDFRWMRDPGNWIMFVFYCSGFIAGQYIAAEGFFKKKTWGTKMALTLLTGIPLGVPVLLLIAIVFVLIGGLVHLVA